MKLSHFPIVLIALLPIELMATGLTIYVAPKGSAAYDNATQLAEQSGGLVERKVHKAFRQAANHLSSCGQCTVTIKLSEGQYQGKARAGMWQFPDVKAPAATLKITGGWNEQFESRQPFTTPSVLLVNPNRSGPVLKFEGRKHALKTLVVSGLIFDTSPSNNYDKETNSLTKSGSSTFGQIAFGYLTTEKLIIADNVFMSAPHGVGGPLLRAASHDTEVILENNIFFNNVYAWNVASGASSKIPKHYVLRGNSFILNWPYNPDTGTANPGAVEIGNKHSAKQIIIENNLFAYNYGGAIHPQWDDEKGPNIAINNNLFYGNGMLFGETDTSSGAIVGKFAGSATHGSYSAEDAEDDFSWDVSGNVSFDPELKLGIPTTKAIGGAARVEASQQVVSETPSDMSVEDTMLTESLSEADELSAELDQLNDLMAGLDDTTESVEQMDEVQDSDSYSPIGGLDLTISTDDTESSGEHNISSYAPKVEFTSDTLPFPNNIEAQSYGASPDRISQY